MRSVTFPTAAEVVGREGKRRTRHSKPIGEELARYKNVRPFQPELFLKESDGLRSGPFLIHPVQSHGRGSSFKIHDTVDIELVHNVGAA